MGTSKSFPGPSGPQPLLPPWAPPGDIPDMQPADSPPVPDVPSVGGALPADLQLSMNWGPAKAALSRVAQRPSSEGMRKAARAFVRSHGGSKNAAHSSASIRRPVGALAAFVSGVTRNGLDPTLNALGLARYIGKPIELVLAGLLDHLAPSGDTNEEADARRATLDALVEMYDRLDLSTDGIEKLNALSEEDLKQALLTSISSYIFLRWIHELGIAIESKKISERQAVALEREMKGYIRARIVYDFGSRSLRDIDFQGVEGRRLVDRILQTAYELIEK